MPANVVPASPRRVLYGPTKLEFHEMLKLETKLNEAYTELKRAMYAAHAPRVAIEGLDRVWRHAARQLRETTIAS